MSDVVAEYQSLQRRKKELEISKSQNEGQLQQLEKNLDQLGYSCVDEAEAALSDLERSHNKLEESISNATKKAKVIIEEIEDAVDRD